MLKVKMTVILNANFHKELIFIFLWIVLLTWKAKLQRSSWSELLRDFASTGSLPNITANMKSGQVKALNFINSKNSINKHNKIIKFKKKKKAAVY